MVNVITAVVYAKKRPPRYSPVRAKMRIGRYTAKSFMGTWRKPGIARHRFANGNERDYNWRPLGPGYRARKAKRYPGQPMMVKTADLAYDFFRRYKIVRSDSGAMIKLSLPKYAEDQRRAGRDITALSPADKAELKIAGRNALARYLNELLGLNIKMKQYLREDVVRIKRMERVD